MVSWCDEEVHLEKDVKTLFSFFFDSIVGLDLLVTFTRGTFSSLVSSLHHGRTLENFALRSSE